MRNITNLLEKADEALAVGLIKNGVIESGKVAAIADFGAVVINLDLLPALAVYENNHNDIVKALGKMVTGNETGFFDYCKAQCSEARTKKEPAQQRLLKEKVIDASIALKIMARTYKIDPKDEQ